MIKQMDKNKIRIKRHRRQRRKLHGTAERPRMNVFRSTNHIYVQLIDDDAGNTLVASSSLDSGIKGKDGNKSDIAKLVGEDAAKKALEKGIKDVVFDRGGYLYTGRVAKVADGAREAGLNF